MHISHTLGKLVDSGFPSISRVALLLALAQAPSPDTCFSHPCSYFSFLLLLNLTHLLNLIINKSQQRVHLKQHNSWANCLNSTQLIHLWPIIPSIFYLDYPVSQPSWAAFSWPLHMAAMPLCPALFSGLAGLLHTLLLPPLPSPKPRNSQVLSLAALPSHWLPASLFTNQNQLGAVEQILV